MFILEMIKAISFTFFEMMKAFIVSFIEFIPAFSLFKDIANAFSYTSIICGIIGIPTIAIVILKFLVKRLSKNTR